ncbi:MAG: histidine--tRNA ligase [Myxococcota bacterium]|jgi:histidyl-tRNA synthetase|nr:histidine--tRNA ligase [Myxococcota bacterium]
MAIKVGIPKGTRDHLPVAMRRREQVLAAIRRVYERHGFEPLETPAIENIETLSGKYGEEGDQLLFRILKRGAKAATGECDLGLRYDLTVPLARVVAMHQNELPKVFKRYQMQPVWRADRPGHGRFREFYQCDIDIVGAAEPVPEIDMLSAVAELFGELGFSAIALRLNDRRVLRGLIERAGVPAQRESQAIVAIDKLDKIGEDGVRRELLARGFVESVADALLELLRTASAGDVLLALDGVFAGMPDALAGVANLRKIVRGLEQMELGATRLVVDPCLARGLDYYTGAIFEVQSEDLAGSLAGGGRYDKLIGMFSGRELPACGVSLGLERILVVMQERGMFDTGEHACDAMLAYFSEDTLGASLRCCARLRHHGLRVDLYPCADKLGKQFAHANQMNIPYVVLIGPEEAEAGVVKLKDMRSGEQLQLDMDALLERLGAMTTHDGAS